MTKIKQAPKSNSCDDLIASRRVPGWIIKENRAGIHQTLVEEFELPTNTARNLDSIRSDPEELERLLHRMLFLYDDVFLENMFSIFGKDDDKTGTRIRVAFGTHLADPECHGLCETLRSKRGMDVKISINSDEIFEKSIFKKQKSYFNGNQPCRTQLECVQLIMEHELVHACLVVYGCKDDDHDEETFGRLAKNLFGHTSHESELGQKRNDDKNRKVRQERWKHKLLKYTRRVMLRMGESKGDDVPVMIVNRLGPGDPEYAVKLESTRELHLAHINDLSFIASPKVEYGDGFVVFDDDFLRHHLDDEDVLQTWIMIQKHLDSAAAKGKKSSENQ